LRVRDRRHGGQVSDRETQPPAAADRQAADFEREIREHGESRARWDRLLALLAEREGSSK
jgi:hypothetical protein